MAKKTPGTPVLRVGGDRPRPAASSASNEQARRATEAGARAAAGPSATFRTTEPQRPPAKPTPRNPASQPVVPGTRASADAARNVTTSARAGTTSVARGAPTRGPKTIPSTSAPRGNSGGRPSAADNRSSPAGRRVVEPAPRSSTVETRDRDGGTKREAVYRVRATQTGFINNERKRPGDVFTVTESEYSDRWMETVDGRTPERTTTPNQVIRQQHDEIAHGRAVERNPERAGPMPAPPGGVGPTGHADPLGTGDDVDDVDGDLE